MPDPATSRLDLRGLPPPEPLVRSLEAAEALVEGAEVVIVTDRRPVHLMPLLHERGFDVEPRSVDGAHELVVRRVAHG